MMCSQPVKRRMIAAVLWLWLRLYGDADNSIDLQTHLRKTTAQPITTEGRIWSRGEMKRQTSGGERQEGVWKRSFTPSVGMQTEASRTFRESVIYKHVRDTKKEIFFCLISSSSSALLAPLLGALLPPTGLERESHSLIGYFGCKVAKAHTKKVLSLNFSTQVPVAMWSK